MRQLLALIVVVGFAGPALADRGDCDIYESAKARIVFTDYAFFDLITGDKTIPYGVHSGPEMPPKGDRILIADPVRTKAEAFQIEFGDRFLKLGPMRFICAD